jgi:hypothetical protein
MWLSFLLLLIIVAIVILLVRNSQYIHFEVDNKNYQIEKYKDDSRYAESLNTLVKIRKNLEKLINHLITKYPNSDKAVRMKQRFENTVLREANHKRDTTQTSNTINKGDTMVLCIRSYGNQLEDMNTLMYVAIHELGHIYSSGFHHGDEFWKNMQFLINEAVSINIYQSVNYAKHPVKYCGIVISSNVPATELPSQQKTPSPIKEDLLMINPDQKPTPNQKGGSFSEMQLISFLLSKSSLL